MSDALELAATNKQIVLDFWLAPTEDKTRFLADDLTWHLPPSLGEKFGTPTLRGDAARAIFGKGSTVYEAERTMDILHVTAEDDRVALHCVLHTRTQAGHDYDGPYHMLFRLEDGRVAEGWEFLDTAYLAARVVPPGE